MKQARNPTYFLQPKNAKSLDPTRVLASEAIKDPQRVQAGIFPPSPGDPDKSAVHGNFITVKEQVENWAPSVRAFLRLYGVE